MVITWLRMWKVAIVGPSVMPSAPKAAMEARPAPSGPRVTVRYRLGRATAIGAPDCPVAVLPCGRRGMRHAACGMRAGARSQHHQNACSARAAKRMQMHMMHGASGLGMINWNGELSAARLRESKFVRLSLVIDRI